MKKVTFVILSLIFSATAFGQTDISTAAVIVEAIQITAGKSLDFGKVDNTGGTVVVAPGGAVTGKTQISSGSGGGAGQITISGGANELYTLDLGTATGTIGGMNITGIISNSTGQLNGSGEEIVGIGATLTVPDGHAPGSYTGTISVTAAYN